MRDSVVRSMSAREYALRSARQCDVYAERTRRRGLCDRCDSEAPALYSVGCECGWSASDPGDFEYCSTCVRQLMALHDPVGAR